MTTHAQPEAKTQFGLTIFLSAFLLFSVQLLLGKYFLPWFGGTPAMWTTCMLFFQVLLLGGYTYAHVISSRLSVRAQVVSHCSVLSGSLLLLAYLATRWNSPITPGSDWKPRGADHPIQHIVTLLAISVGLPYFVLSSTGPLLQSWYRRTHEGHSPYRLYALSNLGSFLALVTYPILLEPGLNLKSQAVLWSCAYALFTVACAYCALRSGANKAWKVDSFENKTEIEKITTNDIKPDKPSKQSLMLWLSLSACASIMFLATTNQICQDIGVVPLLWILPLSVYLLSFVLCFEQKNWYSRGWFHPTIGLAVFVACFVLYDGELGNIFAQVGIYIFVLFIFCMVCNGELARSKPHANYLTTFYLMVAAGGAMGSVFVALIAPHIFRGFWEYQLGVWASTLIVLLILVRDKKSWLYHSRIGSPVTVVAVAALLPESAAFTITHTNKSIHLPVVVALLLMIYVLAQQQSGFSKARERAAPVYCGAALLLLAIILFGTANAHVRNAVALSRNFYGVLAVIPQNSDEPDRSAYALMHGRIAHGYQLRGGADRRTPTAYYGPTSGVGIALQVISESRTTGSNRRIGVVGLGVGTIAAYGNPGDTIRFYEINPDVIEIASNQNYFTFLRDSLARIEVIPGDARLSMERELQRGELQGFDVLAIDAFSGDAIPVHLLTQEAFKIYLEHLKKPSGILAIHITNSYINLKPVIFGAAEQFGLKTTFIHSNGDGRATSESDWALLSQRDQFEGVDSVGKVVVSKEAHIRSWTDDYSNLFQILKK
jgi:hypothetical protein